MPTRNRTKKKKTSPTNRARAAADLTRLCKNIKTTRSGFARAEEMVEAKRLYEAVHPETRRGAAPGKAGGGKSKNATVASFVRFMAKETGLSARAITYDVQIATKLVSAAKDRVRGTDLANRTAALIALSELAERQQLAVIRALAAPTRAAIVAAVAQGPLSIGELAEHLDLSVGTISPAVYALVEAGLVRVERRGRRHLVTARWREINLVCS
ncbi:MAG TPA: ArsR family transcriptional regulator [Polyangiaceae bacterium]